MSERDPRIQAAAEKSAAFNNGRDGFANAGLKNGYVCEFTPKHRLITVDREPGTTSFTIQCPYCEANGGPPGTLYRFPAMRSAMYRVPQDLEPTHEWYRPDTLDGLSPYVRDHVLKGGLVFRSLGLPDDGLGMGE
jgi:hypothetical protein